MDRISGWYKRRMRIIILVLGFSIAILMNVNSLSLANSSWVHKAQRDSLFASATGYSLSSVQSAAEQAYDLRARIDELSKYNLPLG